MLCISTSFAHAGMIGTEQVVATHQAQHNLEKINAALVRDDVKRALLAHGVDPESVKARLDHLTEEELHTLATKFDQLPSASGVGLVLFASGPIIFMLELMGVTDLTTTF